MAIKNVPCKTEDEKFPWYHLSSPDSHKYGLTGSAITLRACDGHDSGAAY